MGARGVLGLVAVLQLLIGLGALALSRGGVTSTPIVDPDRDLERVYLWLADDAHRLKDFLAEEAWLDLADEKAHSTRALYARAQLYRDRGDVEKLPSVLVRIAARLPAAERRPLLLEAIKESADLGARSDALRAGKWDVLRG